MRRFFLPLTLALLLCVSAYAFWQQRTVSGLRRQLADAQHHALMQSAEEIQSLTLSLEKLLISTQAARQAELLHAIALSAEDLQQCLADLPLQDDALAAVLSLAGRLQADASAQLPRTTYSALNAQELNAFAGDLAYCAQLSSQLALAQLPDAAFLSESLAAGDYPLVRSVIPAAPKGLPEEEVTREQARQAARLFIGEDSVSALADAPDASGVLPAYGMTAESNGVQLNLEVTRRGGKILWMMPETAAFSVEQPPESCIASALQFLEERGFGALKAVHYQIYDGLCVISMVPVQEGVLCYPDLLSVQVRMDTLQVVGLEARAYWTNHTQRILASPTLSSADARSRLAPGLECIGTQLCLIPLAGSEALCWQCACKHGADLYYVYIDAATGEEQAIRKVIPLENGTTAA